MSNSLTDEVKRALAPSPGGVTLIITVGNTLRGDDGVGPYIAGHLGETPDNVSILDVGDRPENCIDEAVKVGPVKTVVIDAADFGGRVGEAAIIPLAKIPATTLSTHTFPLPIITKMLEQDTGSEVYFLGVQPESVALGNALCDEVKHTADEIIDFLSKGEKHA